MPDAPPPVPPTAPAAPPPAKSSVLPKILVGCLGVVVLVGILISVGVWWGARKLGLGDAKNNPAAMLAKMATAGNPDLEVVSQDDARKTVTIRNKKTGETLTMNAADLEKGKFELSNEKGEKLTVGGDKEGLKVEGKDGTTVLGGEGAAAAPGWVPAYPGAKPKGTFAQKGAKGEAGAFSFQTKDAVADVLARFEADLQGAGFAVEKTVSGEGMGVIAGKHEGGREVNVTALRSGDATAVTVQYQEKKE